MEHTTWLLEIVRGVVRIPHGVIWYHLLQVNDDTLGTTQKLNISGLPLNTFFIFRQSQKSGLLSISHVLLQGVSSWFEFHFVSKSRISLRIFDQVHNSAPKSRESITNQSSRSRIQHWCHNATHDRTVTSRLRAISESSPCHVWPQLLSNKDHYGNPDPGQSVDWYTWKD